MKQPSILEDPGWSGFLFVRIVTDMLLVQSLYEDCYKVLNFHTDVGLTLQYSVTFHMKYFLWGNYGGTDLKW